MNGVDVCLAREAPKLLERKRTVKSEADDVMLSEAGDENGSVRS